MTPELARRLEAYGGAKQMPNGIEEEDEDDDQEVPDLVDNFEEAAKS